MTLPVGISRAANLATLKSSLTGRIVPRQRHGAGVLLLTRMGGPARHEFDTTRHAQAAVLDWCYGFYNHDRRHSSANMMSPLNYENTAAPDREAA